MNGRVELHIAVDAEVSRRNRVGTDGALGEAFVITPAGRKALEARNG